MLQVAAPARGGGGAYPEKLGGGVRPTSQNPYPIYDQNLRFFLPYLWRGQKFNTLFMTVAAGGVALNLSYEGLLLMFLLKTKKVASSKKYTQLKTRVLKPYPIYSQNGQNRYPIYD